jgi:hypothetical protein
MERGTRSVDWIVVLRGKRLPANTREILYGPASGAWTSVEYRYRLRRAGQNGHLLKFRRRTEDAHWWDTGERSVDQGGWSDLVANVETELEACRNVLRVTRTTP